MADKPFVMERIFGKYWKGVLIGGLMGFFVIPFLPIINIIIGGIMGKYIQSKMKNK